MAPQDRLTTTLSRDPVPLQVSGPAIAQTGGAASVPLLRVEGLSVAYGGDEVVSDVGFTLDAGASLALIGESGSGKSTIARALLRLLPAGVGRASGHVELEGREVLGLPERHFRPLRGRTLGYVPQDPSSSFNPVRTIGAQAHEAARLVDGPDGRPLDAGERTDLVLETFAQVGLTDPRRAYDAYPHELSGGMLQRVLIGLAVLPHPSLLVADEPTSALDVTIQKRILDLLSWLRESLGISLLLITHDLAIAAERAGALIVLKDGVVQEAGPTAKVFDRPSSAYARQLHADVPALNPDRYADLRAVGAEKAADASTPVKIEVRGVTKTFGSEQNRITAVDDVSFAVPAGTTHALVGESGSGKTTAIRLLLGLEQPDAGRIVVAGQELRGRSHAALRGIRRHLQLVYQNPFTSLDPTWRVERLVREPLDRFAIGDKRERTQLVRAALASVGLGEHLLNRKPSALSGGQRQRVAIARALVVRPDVIVLDEPTSALDVSVQADIVAVLMRLQAELGLTYVFVSHDLSLVRQLAHTVSVMQTGRIVEHGTVAQIFDDPQEEYTRTLLDSLPVGAGSAS